MQNKLWLKLLSLMIPDMSSSELAHVRQKFMDSYDSAGIPENEALDAWRFVMERSAERRVEAI